MQLLLDVFIESLKKPLHPIINQTSGAKEEGHLLRSEAVKRQIDPVLQAQIHECCHPDAAPLPFSEYTQHIRQLGISRLILGENAPKWNRFIRSLDQQVLAKRSR